VEANELGSGRDAQLPEDVPQMGVDGSGAQEELRRDRLRAGAGRHEPCDLQLLRCQPIYRCRLGTPEGFAARAQLGLGPLAPEDRSRLTEELERQSQVLPGLPPLTGPPEVLSVEQLRPPVLERPRNPGVKAHRLLELGCRSVILGE